MKQSALEDVYDRISRSSTLDDLNREIVGLRDSLDVENIVYHSVNSTGEQYAALTYSEAWVSEYLERDYARIDPVVQGCFRSFRPVDWKTRDWSGRAAREFFGESQGARVGNQGYSVPVRGPNGQFALVTVTQNCSDDRWALYTGEHTRSLLLISHFLNQKAL